MQHAGRPIGRLELELPGYAAGTTDRRGLLRALAERTAEGFAQTRLEADLRDRAEDLERVNRALERSRQGLLAARDIGRRQVAGRIENEVLTALRPLAGRVDAVAESDPRSRQIVEQAITEVAEVIDRLRRITSGVFSERLTEDGLAAALQSVTDPPRVLGGPRRWSPLVESCLYACCLDLLPGLSGPTTVELAEPAPEVARLVLHNDDLPTEPSWLGSTRERIEALGGQVGLDPGRVRLDLPVIGVPTSV